jgi:hypothetical protein
VAAPAIAVTGAGVVSPIGNTLAAFDAALFAGRSAVRAQALDLPGIDLPPVPVASANFDASGETGALGRASRPGDGHGARRGARRRRAPPASATEAPIPSGWASSGAAVWPAPRPSRRPAARSTQTGGECARPAS